MTPAGIAAAQARVVDLLTAAGIRATVDERDVNPPGVLVGTPVITAFRFGGRGSWTGSLPVVCVVGDTGKDRATAALDDLLGAVLDAVGWQVIEGRPTSLPGLDGAPPLPAYELMMTLQTRVTPAPVQEGTPP